MNEPITPEELNVAALKGVAEDQYRRKRNQYAVNNNTSVAALKGLNNVDRDVIRNTGIDPETYRKNKMAVLAEEVIYYT
ncbi:hypothetical protein [Marinobacterium litorale]|uniref:hypothetical protein n=1 Tax=Marinobacterium litorale TaxID=404770 RepID=UPI0004836515|nr:hypothetical protein [Marinobacterium litorale]